LESCLQRRLMVADREDRLAAPTSGDRGGGQKDQSVQMRELRRRNKSCWSQENEILRRATASFARDVPPQCCTRWSVNSPPRTRRRRIASSPQWYPRW
jgi:hypothetical protein